MWLLLTCAIYPLLLLVATLTDPLLRTQPAGIRFLVIVPIVSAAVVWGVLPFIHRHFGRWLAGS
jgi:antibiotic biosynthesis monooxygenase (ABM) superfamily enzyme